MELHERISTGPRHVQEQEPFADLKNKIHMAVISELGPQLFNVAIDPNELRQRVTADIRRHLNDEAGYGPWPAMLDWCRRDNLAFY